MKKQIKEEQKPESKFVWIGLRLGFWLMVGVWIGLSLTDLYTDFTIFMYIGSVIFTFVLSIIHLTKYKPKKFAITALVISGYGLLSFIIGFFIGLLTYYP